MANRLDGGAVKNRGGNLVATQELLVAPCLDKDPASHPSWPRLLAASPSRCLLVGHRGTSYAATCCGATSRIQELDYRQEGR